MLDTKDLRRGNFLYKKISDDDFEVILVDGIARISIATIDNKRVEKEHLFPIPISQEWILKLGFDIIETFDRGTNPIHGIYASCITLTTIPDFKITFDGNLKFEVGIKYVHQLQNLVFVMTGQDLIYNEKIKL